MKFNFTPDQQMALDFPGNVIVSAGAGSGKTRVLVEKYFRLLLDEHPEWPIDAVVAITFTRKAAAELKARIIKRVLDELNLETVEGRRRQRLLQMRCDVGAAPIGTIHNFCGRILKEFAFDAHLNPDFIVVEGAQEGALRSRAANDAIAFATAGKGAEIYTALLGLLNVMSSIKLSSNLAGMLARRSAYIAPAKEYVGHSMQELFEKLTEFHAEYVNGLRAEMGRSWLSLLRQMEQRALPGKVKEIAGLAVEKWPENGVTDWGVCEQILEQVYSLLTKTGTCRKSEFKKAGLEEDDPIRAKFEELSERCQKARLGELTEVDRADLKLSRQLAFLFLKALEIYEDLRGGSEEEAEAQMLDYSDLEVMAERLVMDNPPIRKQLRERYKYLIVDEFQDTSESQWNILRPLVVEDKCSPRPNSLFVVGDQKQGVYGFRDANVTLFSQVQELVSASNEEWMGCNGRVSMAANFRTFSQPLNFINRVFEKLLTAESASAQNVPFEPLEVMRHSETGCVNFLLAGDGGPGIDEETGMPAKRNADEKIADEARLVAAHISQVLENGEAEPGAIALLFRKRSAFKAYEDALHERGIPVATQQGINLFHQPELADMVAALKAVMYPHKDLVLVHFMRSPLVGFADDLLLKIARTPGRSFYDKACHVQREKRYLLDDRWLALSDVEYERLTFALEVLQDTRCMVGMVSPYKVVNYMVDRLGMRTIVQAGYRAEQAVANIDKLLSVARSAEFISFEEFLEYVESEGLSHNGLAEATDLATADAVKIMTIHAAKGLEFPIVYLPDLNSGTAGTPQTINSDGSKWMTLRLPREQIPVTSFLMEYFKARDEQQSAAEERRVFYVAMTRCEERLILSANSDKSRVRNTFYSWIQDEFERARVHGQLITEADFPPSEIISETASKAAAASNQWSREARIESALRAATQLGDNASTDIGEDNGRIFNPDFLNEALQVFLKCKAAGMKEPVSTAVQEMTRTDLKLENKRLTQYLKLVEDWINSDFNGIRQPCFSGKLRINLPGQVRVFSPHVMTDRKCGWVITAGHGGDIVSREADEYSALWSQIPNAPQPVFLTVNDILEAGASVK